ncbi:MAG: TolC family outer membrane protein [Magnetococcales bacterium]|nr:TolC family outer membrane protein [Magnetococcales bacterium]
MKRGSLTAALLAFMALSQSTTAWSLTLGDAVNEAMRANPKLLGASQELEETRQRIRQAYAGYLPTVDFNMGTGREWTNTPSSRFTAKGGLTLDRGEAGLNINQPLFDGFNTLNKVEQARAQVQAEDYAFLDTAETVTLDVALVYAEVLKQRRLLALAKEAMTIHSEILVKTRQTIKLGITAEMDARLTESRVALIASELAATEGQLRAAESRFSTLVGFPPGDLEPPLIDKKFLPKERSDALETALNRHPSLLSARANLEASRAESKASAASLWPKISLEMAMSDSNNAGGDRGYSQDASAMLRFKYNLFRGGADSSKFKESTHKAARIRDKMEETRDQIEEKVNRSWNTLIASRARLQSLEKHVETMRSVHRDRQEQYRLGSQTMLDFLNSEHELQAARRLLVEEEFQFLMESFRLLSSMGLLKETLIQPDPTPPELVLQPFQKAQEHSRESQSARAPEPLPSLNPSGLSSTPAAAPKPPKKSPPTATERPAPAVLPTDAPLTRAQEEAMDQLVESLFLPEAEQNASLPPDEAVAPPASSQVAPPVTGEEKILAEEARAALLATAGQQGKPSPRAVNQALEALAETMDRSSDANPAPPYNDPHIQADANAQPAITEGDRVTPRELAKLMSLEERPPNAKYPPVDLLHYTIQIGAFDDEASAVKLIGLLQLKGYDLYLQEILEGKDKIWYRVSIGRLENEAEARALLKRFTEQEGRPGFITPMARHGSSSVEQSLPFANAPIPPRAQKPSAPQPSQPATPESHAQAAKFISPAPSVANAASFQPPTTTSLEGFAVQVAAFRNPMETEKRLEQLAPQGFDLHLCETRDAQGHNWQLIWIGRYDTKSSAQAAAEGFFEKSGQAAQVVEIRPSTPEDPQLITRIGGGM